MQSVRILRSATLLIALGLVGWSVVILSMLVGVVLARSLGSVAGYLASSATFLAGLLLWYYLVKIYRAAKARDYSTDVENGRYR